VGPRQCRMATDQHSAVGAALL